MNQGRIWCVVNPSIGLPLFLGGVATISLLVHTSIMVNTNWMADYWAGSDETPVARGDTAVPSLAGVSTGEPGFTVTFAPVASADGKGAPSFVVTMTPNPAVAAPAEAAVDAQAPHARETLALAVPETR